MSKRLHELTGEDWRHLVIALRALTRARLDHALIPAGRIVEGLKKRNPSPPMTPHRSPVDLQRLSWAIGAVAERLPFRADCLLRAMAAERILRRSGFAPQFYLGVTKDGPGIIKAHAWLTCDGISVTGGDASAYTALISAADD